MLNALKIVALLLVAVAQAAVAQSTTQDNPEEFDEVVVVGRVPGPPLWKISKNEHVLWILPLVDLYPKKMEWDITRVKALFSASQEYIEAPFVVSTIKTSNPFHLVRLMNLFKSMEHLSGTKTLVDELPPDLHRRFLDTKSRYFPGNDSIEKMTVSAAPGAIQTAILEHENLTSSALVAEQIGQWMKDNKAIRRTSTGVSIYHTMTSKEITALTAAIKEVSKTPEYAKSQVDCFERCLVYFGKDLGPVKRRANAWAQGHIDDLVNPAPLYSSRIACIDPFSTDSEFPAMKRLVAANPGLTPPDLEELNRKSRQQWLDAAERALTENASTFALLGASDVLAEGGLVAELKTKGYKVEISAP